MTKRKRRKGQAIYLAFNIMALRVPDEAYSRNAPCALNLISTFTRKTKPIFIRFCRFLRLKPSLFIFIFFIFFYIFILSNDYYVFLIIDLMVLILILCLVHVVPISKIWFSQRKRLLTKCKWNNDTIVKAEVNRYSKTWLCGHPY